MKGLYSQVLGVRMWTSLWGRYSAKTGITLIRFRWVKNRVYCWHSWIMPKPHLPPQFSPCTFISLESLIIGKVPSLDAHLLGCFRPHLGKVNLSKGRIARRQKRRSRRRRTCVNLVLDQLRGTVEGSLLGVRCVPSVQSKCWEVHSVTTSPEIRGDLILTLSHGLIESSRCKGF